MTFGARLGVRGPLRSGPGYYTSGALLDDNAAPNPTGAATAGADEEQQLMAALRALREDQDTLLEGVVDDTSLETTWPRMPALTRWAHRELYSG
eukprot:2103614-Amphidinium_carterae.1